MSIAQSGPVWLRAFADNIRQKLERERKLSGRREPKARMMLGWDTVHMLDMVANDLDLSPLLADAVFTRADIRSILTRSKSGIWPFRRIDPEKFYWAVRHHIEGLSAE